MNPDHEEGSSAIVKDCAQFPTTHWSAVVSACQAGTEQSGPALEGLCRTYWFPLFAFLRRSGQPPPDAQDLTQSFFAHLLRKDRLSGINRAKGKFRSFLIASLKNFLANERDKQKTLKRGGEFSFFPLDTDSGETRYLSEPFHELTPERVFEQSWALTVLDAVAQRLSEEHLSSKKREMFEVLQGYLTGDRGEQTYAQAAAKLGITESATKMAVLRMRRRFGELLREEIAKTVSSPEEINEEIRCLFQAVSR